MQKRKQEQDIPFKGTDGRDTRIVYEKINWTYQQEMNEYPRFQ